MTDTAKKKSSSRRRRILKRPQRGPNRRFTDEEIRELRRRLDEGETGAKLAREKKVSMRTIYDIKSRVSYHDVK